MPRRGQKGGAMNDILPQHSAQTPSPSTGSRQETHNVGSATSSASFEACDQLLRIAVNAARTWEESERVGEASVSMVKGYCRGVPLLKRPNPDILQERHDGTIF